MENEKYLQRFADDEQMFEAVRGELKKSSETRDIDTRISNEELGAEIRARLRAKDLVEEVFKRIKTFKTEKTKGDIINLAR